MSSLPPDDDRTIIRPPAGAAAGTASVPETTGGMAAHDSDNALPPGTWLGEFEITGVLGEGGFGIVYLAQDHSLERQVALKEYMPSALAARKGRSEVQVKSERHRETFEAGLKSFVNEAKLLARFDHPSLVKVYRFWEAHGTAYMVMPFYEGITLKDQLRQWPGPPDEAWLMGLLAPLTEALAVIHAENCFHRDIAPDNVILLAGSGKPMLLDFGAARRVIGDMTQALTVILKPGYAPVEQYAEAPGMKQGPWTDVYALAASVHFAILGKTPPASVGRLMGDNYAPLAEAASRRYSERFLRAMDKALQVRPEQRTQSIAALRADLGLVAFSAGSPASGPMPTAPVTPAAPSLPLGRPVSRPTAQDGRPTVLSARPTVSGAARKRLALAAGAAALVAGGMAAYFTAGTAPRSGQPALAVSGGSAASGAVSTASASAPARADTAPPGSSPEPAAVAASVDTAATPSLSPSQAAAREFDRVLAAQTPAYTVSAKAASSRLRIGRDQLQFTVTSARAGYLNVFVLGPDGALMLLYPNRMAPRNRIEAGRAVTLPQRSWQLDTLPPAGPERVLAVVSKLPRELAALRSARDDAVLNLPPGTPSSPTDVPLLLGLASSCSGAGCDEFGAADFTVEVVPP